MKTKTMFMEIEDHRGKNKDELVGVTMRLNQRIQELATKQPSEAVKCCLELLDILGIIEEMEKESKE